MFLFSLFESKSFLRGPSKGPTLSEKIRMGGSWVEVLSFSLKYIVLKAIKGLIRVRIE